VPDLTIASLNMHWGIGPRRLGFPPFDIAEVCKGFDADVIVLQESWAPDDGEAHHDTAAGALGYEVVSVQLSRGNAGPPPHIVSRRDPERTGGTGDWCLAVLTRLPILDTRAVWLPDLWLDPSSRVLLHLDLSVDGSPLTVVATHYSHLEFGSPLQTRALRRGLPSSDRAAAFIGDMNMWGWCASAMTPRGWRRVGRGRTYPASAPHSRIDHLLVTPSVEVLSTTTGPDVGSDHLPIRAELRIR
jgi:endonuclease/exonuclease/phosphatase family metal-dependent hydrolase